MKNLKTMAASFFAAMTMLVAISGSAFAGSPGQLAGGDNYVVKNLTKQGSYSNSVTAACNEELQYSMQLSNTQFGALNNVTLTATLPSTGGTSTATATTDLGGVSGTTDTASVSLPSGATQSLVSGSVTLYDGNGGVIKTLPDTITSGVNIGTLNGSTTEFVNFKVKVNCPAPVVSTAECSATSVQLSDGRKATVSVNTTVNNATVVAYKVDYGDGFVATTKDSSHTYAKDGTYRIVASVQVKYADGTTAWITSDGCAKNVTFTTPTPGEKCKVPGKENLESTDANCKSVVTTVTPAPTVLPSTGAGSVAAIFGGVTALATLGYGIVSRRLSRQ